MLIFLEKVEGREWTIDEVIGKFQSTSVGQFWKLAFIEGVELTERIFKGKYKERSVEDVPFFARYDMTIITPCFHQVRCKVILAVFRLERATEVLELTYLGKYFTRVNAN